nr:RDD family protein [Pseudoteredinibacter isoporae]
MYDLEEQEENPTPDDHPSNCAASESEPASLQADVQLAEASQNGNDTVDSFEQAQESLWQSDESDNNNEQWQEAESQREPEKAESTVPEGEPLSEEQQAIAQHYQQQLERLDQQLERLLATPKECKKLHSWLFLNEFPELTDYEFWIEASRLVYHRIADSQSPEYKGKHPNITREVLDFLDSIFNWFEYLQDPEEPAYNHHQTLYNRVQSLHISVDLDALLDSSSSSETTSSFTQRFFATFIDCILLSLFFILCSWAFKESIPNTLFTAEVMSLLAFLYYLTAVTSPLQGTIGHWVASSKVVTSHGEPPSVFDALRRGSGFIVLLVCIALPYQQGVELSGGKLAQAIIVVPMVALYAWTHFNNTLLVSKK